MFEVATAEKEYDKLPDNIFETSDNSPQAGQKPSVAGSDKKQPEPSKIFSDSGMAKAPLPGFEAFFDNQLGMSGGRTLSGFDKVSGGVYNTGRPKG